MRDNARPGAAMLHPAVWGSIALLVVNDHVLKHAWPGVITGKLSDFAGLVFFPVLLWSLAEVVARRPLSSRARLACIALTGVVFALTKTCPPFASSYATCIALLQWPARALFALAAGGAPPGVARVSFVVDPTDLVALPALAAPLWLARRGAR